MRTVYLDNNATTPVAPEVRAAMEAYFTAEYFDPSSAYDRASPASQAIKRGRETLARFLGGVDPSEILFTSCATESLNTALYGAVRANPGRRHVVTTAVEHPAVYEVCKDLARSGLEVTFLPVDRAGNLRPSHLHPGAPAGHPDRSRHARQQRDRRHLPDRPIGARHQGNRSRHSLPDRCHPDRRQASPGPSGGPGPRRPAGLRATSSTAPKGVGALFVRRGTPSAVMIGGHQEGGRRAGTENAPYIAALTGLWSSPTRITRRWRRASGTGWHRLQAVLLPASRAWSERSGRAAHPQHWNLSIHFIEGEGILHQAERGCICASSGSACTSGSLEPSDVLRAMQAPFSAVPWSTALSRVVEHRRGREPRPGGVPTHRRQSPAAFPYWDQAHERPGPRPRP